MGYDVVWLDEGCEFFGIQNLCGHGAGFCPDCDCIVAGNELRPDESPGVGVDFGGGDGGRFLAGFGV